jgi:hypothetical protein
VHYILEGENLKEHHPATGEGGLPACCPPLEKDDCCDTLEYRYRLTHRTLVRVGERSVVVPVEVTTHVRLDRCPGPLLLGDPIYSTTLLPGEQVRLFSSDRNTRFSFDSETKLSYRHAQASEEQFYMASMDRYMSDLTATDKGSANANSGGEWKFHGEATGSLGFFSASADADANGSYSAHSHSDFTRELSRHASSSHNRAQAATRSASSIQIGEVSTRTHIEGESEDHFESSSRVFRNPNKCHAVTFVFYRINKRQTLKFTLVGIHRRVIDAAGNSRVSNRAFQPNGELSVIPDAVRAADSARLEVEARARQAVAAQAASENTDFPAGRTAVFANAVAAFPAEPLSRQIREQALKQVDEELVEAGLLDAVGGEVSDRYKAEISFERCLTLPTGGVIVKGCYDECDICEPALMKEIELDLERKRLQNELLKRQIELLDKAQEYRCCPAAATEE